LALVALLVSPLGSGGFSCIKTSHVFFFDFFASFPTRKRQKGDFAKNNISSDSFYPSVGSIIDKTTSKVIEKVNTF
jgi:hypothetical protein